MPESVAPAPDTGGEPASVARTDERLARAAQAGDGDAFNLLVLRHERTVFSLCLRLLRDVPAAEAATQAASGRAWREIAGYRGDRPRPWLLRIAVGCCRDGVRTGPRRPSTPLDAELAGIEPAAAAGEAPEAIAPRAELAILLERALAALPVEQRLVVLLADVHRCDAAEVAAVTGAALGTIGSRLGRGRGRLRQALGDDPVGAAPFARFAALSAGRLDRGGEVEADIAEHGGGQAGHERAAPGPAQHLHLDALTSYLDGGMEEADRRAATAHLAGCLDCRRELTDLGATVDLLRGLPHYAPRRSFRLGAEHAPAAPGGRLARLWPVLATRGR